MISSSLVWIEVHQIPLTEMSILKKLVTQPIVAKYFLNHFAPFKGAGIQIEKFDLKHYHIRVKMPLTRQNRNICRRTFWRELICDGRPFLYDPADAPLR